MTEILKVEIFYIEICHIIALIGVILFSTVLYLRGKKNKLTYFFMYVQLMMVIWIISKILKTVSPNVTLRWFFVVVQYFGISFLQCAFLEFSYIYFKNRMFKRKTRIFIYCLSLSGFCVVLTNPMHYLFYSSFNFTEDFFGPLFYVYMALEYSFILLGIVFCSIRFFKQFASTSKTFVFLTGIAILFPVIFNVLYVSTLIEKFLLSIGINFVFDITPIAFSCSLIMFSYVIFKYNFIDIIPMVKNNIISELDTVVVVTDLSYYIKDCNIMAKNVFEIDFKKDNSMKKSNFSEIVKKRYNLDLDEELFRLENKSFEIEESNKFYEVVKRVYKNKKAEGYIFTATDISKYIELNRLMTKKNVEYEMANKELEGKIILLKDLSQIRAKNYIAHELHDVLGHSVTLFIKLCEVAEIMVNENNKDAVIKMSMAKEIINKGFCELVDVANKNKLKKLYDTIRLRNEIEYIIKVLKQSGTEVKSFFRGKYRILSKEEYITLKRICQEAVANSIKHGKADKIVILFSNFSKNELSIIDNGVGCKALNKGNGLSGIEYRVEQLNGSVCYNFNENEGFELKISI